MHPIVGISLLPLWLVFSVALSTYILDLGTGSKFKGFTRYIMCGVWFLSIIVIVLGCAGLVALINK